MLDYKSKSIYLWSQSKWSASTPRSSLKSNYKYKKRNKGKVNFNSTEAESLDSNTDTQEEEATRMPEPKNAAANNRKTAAKNQEWDTKINPNPNSYQRYPRRTKK